VDELDKKSKEIENLIKEEDDRDRREKQKGAIEAFNNLPRPVRFMLIGGFLGSIIPVWGTIIGAFIGLFIHFKFPKKAQETSE